MEAIPLPETSVHVHDENVAREERRKMNRSAICLWNGYRVDVEELKEYTCPVSLMGNNYHPYEHYDMICDIEEQVRRNIGEDAIYSREIVLNDRNLKPEGYSEKIPVKGAQMFGMFKLDMGEEHSSNIKQLEGLDLYDPSLAESDLVTPTLGFRNSIDGSLSVGVLYGNMVNICANGCFSGDNATMFKHTPNSIAKMIVKIRELVKRIPLNWKLDYAFRDELKSIHCSDDEAFSIFGILRGRGLLLPNQASVAYAEMRKPTFDVFGEKNMWSVLNHITFAKKSGNGVQNMKALENITKFFQDDVIGTSAWGKRKAAVVGGEQTPVMVPGIEISAPIEVADDDPPFVPISRRPETTEEADFPWNELD
jgi:hypothetical protein